MTDETQITENPNLSKSPTPPDSKAVVETQTTTTSTVVGPPKPSESQLLNMSVRAWIGMIIVVTMCALCAAVVILPVAFPSLKDLSPAAIPDVLKDAFLVTIAFFFGQASKPKTQTQ